MGQGLRAGKDHVQVGQTTARAAVARVTCRTCPWCPAIRLDPGLDPDFDLDLDVDLHRDLGLALDFDLDLDFVFFPYSDIHLDHDLDLDAISKAHPNKFFIVKLTQIQMQIINLRSVPLLMHSYLH